MERLSDEALFPEIRNVPLNASDFASTSTVISHWASDPQHGPTP